MVARREVGGPGGVGGAHGVGSVRTWDASLVAIGTDAADCVLGDVQCVGDARALGVAVEGMGALDSRLRVFVVGKVATRQVAPC